VLPVAHNATLDRIRECRWGVGGYGEPRTECPGPHLLFIALRDEAHQPWFGWAPPIRARVRVRLGRWTEPCGDQTNTDQLLSCSKKDQLLCWSNKGQCELFFHVTLHSPKKLLPFFHFEFVSFHAFDHSTGVRTCFSRDVTQSQEAASLLPL
jgi:hypothetical protein